MNLNITREIIAKSQKKNKFNCPVYNAFCEQYKELILPGMYAGSNGIYFVDGHAYQYSHRLRGMVSMYDNTGEFQPGNYEILDELKTSSEVMNGKYI